jgi:hypothetical protein
MRMRSAHPPAARLRDHARDDGAHNKGGGDLGRRPRGADTG